MLQLAVASLTQPGPSIQQVLRMPLSDAILFRMAVLLACINGIMDPLVSGFIIPADEATTRASPIFVAGFQLALTMITAFATDRIGALFGGEGNFNGAFKVSVWYGVVSILPTLVILVLLASGNPIGVLIVVGISFWMLSVFASFVRNLHGFSSQFLTILGVIGSTFFILFLSMIVLSMLGIVE